MKTGKLKNGIYLRVVDSDLGVFLLALEFEL